MLRYCVAGFVLALSAPMAAVADEKVSCDDLVEIANSLDEVADAMEKGIEIKEDSQEDKGLREITDGLTMIAQSENNDNLLNAVKKMDQAWEAMDRTNFIASLDRVTELFDAIRKVDCP